MLKAVRDTIIVEIEYAEKSKGGIVIPEVAKQYNGAFVGKVVSVGPDYEYGVKPGDTIAYERHEGWRIRYAGKNYIALRNRWVVGRYHD